MTTEQREFNLDKRIALFGNTLQFQICQLESMTNKNPLKDVALAIKNLTLLNQRAVIKSKRLVNFPKGGTTWAQS